MNIQQPQTTEDALKLALFLAITAPTDEKATDCMNMAHGFAECLTDGAIEVAMAKAQVMATAMRKEEATQDA